MGDKAGRSKLRRSLARSARLFWRCPHPSIACDDEIASAQEKLEKDLRKIEFAALRFPLVTNVDADTETSGDEARDALIRQVTMPVRWEESVRELIDEGVNTFVEVGPSRVLTGLLRQIERSVGTLNVEDEKSLATTVEKIAQSRADAA